MDSQTILSYAKELHEQILIANSYWGVIQQLDKNTPEINECITYSPGFYATIYHALVEGLMITLGRIYDTNKDSVTIRKLLSSLENYPVSYLCERVLEKYHAAHNKFTNILGKEVQIDELHKVFFEKFNSLSPQINNLWKQRCMTYAHIDKKSLSDIHSLRSKYPIFPEDINDLISFAFELIGFFVYAIEDHTIARDAINTNDWSETVKLVQLGALQAYGCE